jgi:coenzyme F420-reducing hydrogenase delta subunit
LKSASKVQFEDSIKEAVDKTAAKGPVIVFACQQSAALSLKTASQIGLSLPENSIIIEVPCAGRIEENLLLYALVNGASKVIVSACHYDICRSLKGNILASKRVERVKKFLTTINLSTDLIHFLTIAANEPYRISNLIHKIVSEPNTRMVSEAV